jgi:hypothetical protein
MVASVGRSLYRSTYCLDLSRWWVRFVEWVSTRTIVVVGSGSGGGGGTVEPTIGTFLNRDSL